ncbi:MAG: helix-turn-helix transcriptional regulator [Clostridiaceae bacterium]|nr:helix-turn-helix transcriptional regulator [Clostridiaceae bacterium]
MLGITQQYYSKYETGKYELPLRYIIALADFYKVSNGLSTRQDGVPRRNRRREQTGRRRLHSG